MQSIHNLERTRNVQPSIAEPHRKWRACRVTPELIQAIGVAIAAVLGGWQALTSRKVRDLETRLKAVETERDEFRTKLRAAVRHIREWMGWALDHAPGTSAPPLPLELRDEV